MGSKIVLYKGRRGCGKTLTIVKDGLLYFKNGWKVLRNFDCAFGELITNEQIIHLDKNSELFNAVILIDELQILFDSRRSMKKENISFSNFVQQVRKRNIIILGATQYANTVDLRFRQHADIVCYPNYLKELKVCECIYVDVTSIEDTILHTVTQPKFVKTVYDARPIFQLYNTEQMLK